MIFRNVCRSCLKKFRISSFSSTYIRHFTRTCVSKKNDEPFKNQRLKIRYIYVQTCVNVWEDVPNGVLFDVCYADSHPDDDIKITSSLPTILALHNSPGSHEDLSQFLEYFVSMGCRVIAPNFPGFGQTDGVIPGQDYIFAHTNEEKSQFVCDFLSNLGVKRVDMVIGHGAGCYPILRLCTSQVTKDMFKSAVFLSPWPVVEDFRLIQPISLHRTIVWMWENTLLKPLAYLLVHSVKIFTGFSEFIAKDFIYTSYTICGVDFAEVAGFASGMNYVKIPKLILFGENDEYIPSPLVEDFAKMIGIPVEEIIECDEKGVLNKPKEISNECPSSVIFLHGGKNFFNDYEKITMTMMWKLLKQIRQDVQ